LGADGNAWRRSGAGQWTNLGGPFKSTIQYSGSGSGFEFALGTDNAIWYRQNLDIFPMNLAPIHKTTAWKSLGQHSSVAPIAATSGLGNRVYEWVFILGDDGRIWANSLMHPSVPDLYEGAFEGWRPIGTKTFNAAPTAEHPDYRGSTRLAELHVYARGADNQMWNAWLNSDIDDEWSDWAPLGGAWGSGSGPAAAKNFVFARGNDNKIYYRENSATGWGDWVPLPFNATFKDGVGTGIFYDYSNGGYLEWMEVFARNAADNKVYRIRFTRDKDIRASRGYDVVAAP
jgi:hypothetical protein